MSEWSLLASTFSFTSSLARLDPFSALVKNAGLSTLFILSPCTTTTRFPPYFISPFILHIVTQLLDTQLFISACNMSRRSIMNLRLARSHSTDNNQLVLPTLVDYIEHHIDHDVPLGETDDHICPICQYAFAPPQSDDQSSSSDDTPDNTSVRISPCGHLFHANCILTWLSSLSSTRNTCPICRVLLFRPNVFTPGRAAERYADTLPSFDRHWRAEPYIRLIEHVDSLISPQLALQDPDFSPIPRAARLFWENGMDRATISSEHLLLGSWWVEMVAAGRVLEWLEEDGAASKGWAGQLFLGMYCMLEATIQQVYVVQRAIVFRDRALARRGMEDEDGSETEMVEEVLRGAVVTEVQRMRAGQGVEEEDEGPVDGAEDSDDDGSIQVSTCHVSPASEAASQVPSSEASTIILHPRQSSRQPIHHQQPSSQQQMRDNSASPTQINQWVASPRMPPIRPVPEPIDDFVQLPQSKRKREKNDDPTALRRSTRNAWR
ncbi:hypothetical protein DE146DRAFT_138576 [Phaeosphaeria sp. MPI-PUGE-AT-0046c]|nr:hypothetical protein DE146DRAFT_138576 [Phaeosphaeria sp. MPI-PUGE-AT-0046c]